MSIKRFVIAYIEGGCAVELACSELERYIKRIDPDIMVECRKYLAYKSDVPGCIWVGRCGSVPTSEVDTVCIRVKSGSGIIDGSNDRSVLFAVYRFLYELGCRFLRPGTGGDIIPTRELDISELCIDIYETESYHHRAVCIEGAVSYEHVKNMIEWLPKVYMNGYYLQFKTPFTFFDRWYSHVRNPMYDKEPLSMDDVTHICKMLIHEAKRRGLYYHAVGHGWTCEPLGIVGASWAEHSGALSPDLTKLLALLNGKRQLFNRIGINTNLCYSNPQARNVITDAIAEYCAKNPEVDYLHFWLADDKNNQCECDTCKSKRPSDWYVIMLNELDKKLTAMKITTKIVFLVYVDLLWCPIEQKIKNMDRFTLMFAPITRTYTNTLYSGSDDWRAASLPPYTRNELIMPKDVFENLAHLSAWQEQVSCDSFDFDYHLMWDYVKDMGLQKNARTLHDDMKNLDKLGLNGMVSCQVQRCAFPVNLPMYAMSKALWNKASDFDSVCDEYFVAQFGEYSDAVADYLRELSELADPRFMRKERPIDNSILKAITHIESFERDYISGNKDIREWRFLKCHAHMCKLLIRALYESSQGNSAAVLSLIADLDSYTQQIECDKDIAEVFDYWNYSYVVHACLKLPVNPNE